MAVWQYDFRLVSANWFKNIDLEVFISSLEDVFGKVFERDDNKIVIGDFESNLCSIYYSERGIDEVSCRLDMRLINQDVVGKIKGIIDNHKLKFLIIEEKIVDGQWFIEKLKTSSAMKFVNDSEKFIEDIASEKNNDDDY